MAGALPPMVKDQHLFRLQAKYVDQHADGSSKSPPRPRPARLAPITRPEEIALDSLSVQDSPGSSTSSRKTSEKKFENDLTNSLHSSVSSNPTSPSEGDHDELPAKKTFESMFQQSPPICTLPTRVDMIDDFNTQLRAFCAKHPDVLEYIEINDSMRKAHPDRLVDTTSTSVPKDESEDEREMMIRGMPIIKYYASSAEGDGANVHPTWERTYPLWLDKLREVGVDVDTFPQVDMEELERKLAEYVEQKGGRLLTSKYRTAS